MLKNCDPIQNDGPINSAAQGLRDIFDTILQVNCWKVDGKIFDTRSFDDLIWSSNLVPWNPTRARKITWWHECSLRTPTSEVYYAGRDLFASPVQSPVHDSLQRREDDSMEHVGENEGQVTDVTDVP